MDNSSLAAGTTISHYRVVSQLGAGGMGEVYLAQDSKLDRKVALKILTAEVAADRGRMGRFVQEAKAVSALNHPNILTIYEVDQANSVPFIATEFIDGETLRQRMKRAPLKLGDVLDVTAQIASALSAAHAAGIVHRDIKPENIMLRQDGIAKVLDFGLAKLTERLPPDSVDTEAPTSFKTDPGTIMGTAVYMSPEQARGMAVDARTDIFSLGVVLYEMVAGCLPFGGSTSSEVVASILSEREPQPLARYSREVPAELERVVSKALRKNKDERYQTIKDLLIDLKECKRELELQAHLDRRAPSELRSSGTTDGSEAAIGEKAQAQAAQTGADATHGTSSAEYIVRQIERHKRGALLVLAMLLATTVAYFAYSRYFAGGSTNAIQSIAVLPFANTGGNPDAEYLSDGISESLINSLSQLPSMKVIARSSSFQYKGKEIDPQEVARALGVEAILTGRVAQRGENLLISVELVDARDKTQVWGEQYNRKATDLLQVQSEISDEIARKLRLRLTAGEQKQLAKRETVNPAAYELLLKGRFYWNKGGVENWKKAVEYFQQAIAVDPTYALAYAELSLGYRKLVDSSILDPKEGTPKVEAAARKALELDESLADAHLALASVKRDAWEWASAEREYERAIELNPNLARAHNLYSFYLTVVGRHEQAIAEVKRARELDPLSLDITANVGFRLFLARQYDQAIEAWQKMLELDRNYLDPHLYLGYTYAAKGMYPEAIAAYQEAVKLGDDSPSTQIYLGAAYAKAGDRDRAHAILKQLQASKEYVSPGELAVFYTALGEREQAFASLEKAYEVHDLQLQYLGVDPAFDSLRSDGRFKDLMRRVGL